MPRNLEQMGVEAIIKGLPQYLSGMDRMGKATSDTQGIIGRIGGIAKGAIGGTVKIGAAAGAAAIGGVAALSGALFKLASDAAPIAGIKQSFEDLTASMEGGSEAVLKALQEQSAGMVTNTDLMKSYNLASLLIGESFTKQLPDAMGFVGKVAMATGEDMGFLMDSLVRGVGRLSPMILDNLGITVNLTEAYEAWAKENGRTVDSMTKAEQQAAVMEQTMAKLAEKTADMPEVAGSSQQAFKSFGVQMKNFKDELGLAVLPSVTEIVGAFSEMAKKVLPRVIDFVKKNVVPIFEKVGYVLSAIADAGIGSTEMWEALENLLGTKFTNTIKDVYDFIKTRIIPVFETVWGVLKGIIFGDASFENLIPPWLLNIWEGVKDLIGTIADVISQLAEKIIPWLIEKYNLISDWFEEHEPAITQAIQNISDFFSETLGPAISTLWENVLAPFFDDFIGGILDVAGTLIDFFGQPKKLMGPNITMLPPEALEKKGISAVLDEIGKTVQSFFETDIPKHFRNFRDWVLDFFGLPNWEEVADSWRGIWENIKTTVSEAITIIEGWLEDFWSGIKKAFDDFGLVAEALQGSLPAWEKILGGELGPPNEGFQRQSNPTDVLSPDRVNTSGGYSSHVSEYNLTINTNAPYEPIVSDYRLMRALGGIP